MVSLLSLLNTSYHKLVRLSVQFSGDDTSNTDEVVLLSPQASSSIDLLERIRETTWNQLDCEYETGILDHFKEVLCS